MLAEDREILDQFARDLVGEIKGVVGSFADSVDYRIDEDALTIDASPFIGVLINGRGPTRKGARRGNPTLQETILAWIQRHNITPRPDKNGKTPSIESLSFAISKSIHVHGTLLYRSGGRRNIFDTIITNQRIEALLSQFGEAYRNRITSQLLTQVNRIT